ncbi:hypothetical protein ACFWM1_26545 [Nocardia sp. NPDC058379]|uniref:hypothetical protein n=1 Tax=unclassified Nocardia TaxID=2637762 RepID=UPI003655B1EF
MTCTVFEQDSPLPTGTAILGSVLGWSTDAERSDPILAAAAELVELARAQAQVGEPLRAARVEQMRRIDAAVSEALPVPSSQTPPHTETIGMAVARMADYAARLDQDHTPTSLIMTWGPLYELARALDGVITDLITGRRRVPLSIWWAGFGAVVPAPEHP